MRGAILPTGSSEPAAGERPAPPAEGNLPARQAGTSVRPRERISTKRYIQSGCQGPAWRSGRVPATGRTPHSLSILARTLPHDGVIKKLSSI